MLNKYRIWVLYYEVKDGHMVSHNLEVVSSRDTLMYLLETLNKDSGVNQISLFKKTTSLEVEVQVPRSELKLENPHYLRKLV